MDIAASWPAALTTARDHEFDGLRAVLRDTKARLAEYEGKGLRPRSGCVFHRTHLDEASVLVEYEFTPGEDPIYDLESPVCGPGHPDELELVGVLLNARWCDPADVFSESQIERITGEIYSVMEAA